MEQEKTQQGMSKEQLRSRLDVFSSGINKIKYIKKITDKYFILHPQTRLNLETILLEEKIKEGTLDDALNRRAYNPKLTDMYPKVLSDLINSGIELTGKSFIHALEFYYESKEDVPTGLSSKLLKHLNKGIDWDEAKTQPGDYPTLWKGYGSDEFSIAEYILKDVDKNTKENMWGKLFINFLRKGVEINETTLALCLYKEGWYRKLESRSGGIDNNEPIKKFCSEVAKKYLSGAFDFPGNYMLMRRESYADRALKFLKEANDKGLYKESIDTLLKERWDEHPLALRTAIESGHADLIEKTERKLKDNLELAIEEEGFYYAHKMATTLKDEEAKKRIHEKAKEVICLAEEYVTRNGESGYMPVRAFMSKDDLFYTNGGVLAYPGIISAYAGLIGDSQLGERAIDLYSKLYKLEHPLKIEEKPQPTAKQYEEHLNLNGLRKLKWK